MLAVAATRSWELHQMDVHNAFLHGDIIAEAGLLGAKPSNVSIEQNHRLALAADLSFPHPNQYRRLVGRLIYLCFTKPEFSY